MVNALLYDALNCIFQHSKTISLIQVRLLPVANFTQDQKASHNSEFSVSKVGLSCQQVAVAVLVGLLTISTWYFTHSYPKSAVASLSESLRYEILENTSELLDEIFSMNTYGSMAIANLMEKNFLGDDFTRENFMQV